MITEQKQLLENWKQDLNTGSAKALLKGVDVRLLAQFNLDLENLVEKLLKAKEAQVREEERKRAFKILGEMQFSPEALYDAKTLEVAQQKILN